MPAPINTVAPSVTGLLTVGAILTCSTGAWNNNPVSFSYQWRRNGIAISTGKSSTFTIRQTDIGAGLSCEVRAANADGIGVTQSNTVNPGTAGPAWPPETPSEPTWGENPTSPQTWNPSTATEAGWAQN